MRPFSPALNVRINRAVRACVCVHGTAQLQLVGTVVIREILSVGTRPL
jgi:hypothetical protein